MRVIVTQPDGPVFHFTFCRARITSNMAALDFNVIPTRGDPGVGVPTGGTTGQVLQKATNADYETEWSDPSGGASVASAAEVKAGTASGAFIAPSVQDASAFYALAKAAGDSSQSQSSNPVGTYTDAARVAIQKMLGVYQAPFRTIKTITITEETGIIYFNRDDDNQEFSLTEIVVLFQAVTATANGNGVIVANNGSEGTGANVAFVTIYNIYNTSAQTRVAHALITGGRFLGESSAASYGNTYGTQTIHRNLNSFGIIACDPIYELMISSLNGYKLTGGTIIVYGR